eukprot:TRINITY_DN8580_c0_g1_i1.p1 TRINITY_DN8580_c0_g1~~TRINITY_DN8580_c0_g1_i1.p1  ORF type:complete len:537 (-),score=162.26 TRINITY_DN8580_c0_g1_i1:26-1636(-)
MVSPATTSIRQKFNLVLVLLFAHVVSVLPERPRRQELAALGVLSRDRAESKQRQSVPATRRPKEVDKTAARGGAWQAVASGPHRAAAPPVSAAARHGTAAATADSRAVLNASLVLLEERRGFAQPFSARPLEPAWSQQPFPSLASATARGYPPDLSAFQRSYQPTHDLATEVAWQQPLQRPIDPGKDATLDFLRQPPQLYGTMPADIQVPPAAGQVPAAGAPMAVAQPPPAMPAVQPGAMQLPYGSMAVPGSEPQYAAGAAAAMQPMQPMQPVQPMQPMQAAPAAQTMPPQQQLVAPQQQYQPGFAAPSYVPAQAAGAAYSPMVQPGVAAAPAAPGQQPVMTPGGVPALPGSAPMAASGGIEGGNEAAGGGDPVYAAAATKTAAAAAGEQEEEVAVTTTGEQPDAGKEEGGVSKKATKKAADDEGAGQGTTAAAASGSSTTAAAESAGGHGSTTAAASTTSGTGGGHGGAEAEGGHASGSSIAAAEAELIAEADWLAHFLEHEMEVVFMAMGFAICAGAVAAYFLMPRSMMGGRRR